MISDALLSHAEAARALMWAVIVVGAMQLIQMVLLGILIWQLARDDDHVEILSAELIADALEEPRR